jgi:hypothetical protein
MIVLSKDECSDWAKRYKVQLDERSLPVRCNGHPHRLRSKFPGAFTKMLHVARAIESSLYINSQCLVWITGWEIWPSSENWQLFYRYRQSYGSNKLLLEAPGHLFLPYERAEIATMVWLGMLQGWDVHVFPDNVWSNCVFVSNDEWIEIGYEELAAAEGARNDFAEAKLEFQLKKIAVASTTESR